MTSALGYGLMGAAQGALAGLYDRWQNTQSQIQTERLMRAKALEEERLAHIAAMKDERDHEQSKELKGMELSAAEKRQQASIESADRRAREGREASDARAKESSAARIRAAEISANRPRGSSSTAKPQLFTNDAGEQKWVTPGEDIPTGFYRAPSSGKAKPSPTTKPANQPGSSRNNPIKASTLNDRPPSGTWVELPSGFVTQVP